MSDSGRTVARAARHTAGRTGTRPHTGRVDRRGATLDQAHAALAAHLTIRDRWCIRMLAEHRVLTTAHLAAAGFDHRPRLTRRRLQILRALGAVDAFHPLRRSRAQGGSAPLHWVAPPLAYAVLAAEDGHELAPAADSRQVGRGVALAHNAQLGHQLAVNTLLIDLLTNLQNGRSSRPAHTPAGRLTCWWGQARCTHHLAPARPDAYAVWTAPDPVADPVTGARPGPDRDQPVRASGRVGFALEWDTGSEPLARLAAKLRGYEQLALASAIITPVVIWLPGPRREHNARAALHHAHTALDHPALVPVLTTHTHPRATAPAHRREDERGERPGRLWHPGERILAPLEAGADVTRPGQPAAGGPANRAGLGRLSLLDLASLSPAGGLTHAELHEPSPTYPCPTSPDPDLDPGLGPDDPGHTTPVHLGLEHTGPGHQGPGHDGGYDGDGVGLLGAPDESPTDPGQLNATAWRMRPSRMWRSPHPTPPPAWYPTRN